jgi:hypothetical protein
VPPEVPEEFAAAYRAAYAQALEAQTGGPTHRAHPDADQDAERALPAAPEGAERALPARHGPLVVGTHRSDADDSDPTWFERVRDSTWFVPFLLLLLALLLIVGAYVVGRRFAEEVGAGDAAGPAVSRTIVTGPSLTSATAMSAPKTPRSTWVPAAASASHTAS